MFTGARGLYKRGLRVYVGQWLWLVSIIFIMNTSGVVSAGHASALIYWDKCGFHHLLVFLFSSLLGAFAKFRKAILALSCLFVRLSIRVEQLGSQWTYFDEI